MTTNDKATMIRPGLIVCVNTRCAGGVSYSTVPLDVDGNEIPEGSSAEVVRWQTTRVTDDPAERERASKARNKALTAIKRSCARTAFGLLCPEAKEADLDAGIAEARAIAAEFNASSVFTKVTIHVLKGRVASDDRAAATAIAQEVRELMEEMQSGIQNLDAEAVREAADKAKEIGAMLAPEQAEKVSDAVAQARKAARQIVARVAKGGEDAAIVLADIQRGAIEKARIAFLDFDTEVQAAGEAMPAVQLQRVAGLDLDVQEQPSEPALASAPARHLDLGSEEVA